MSYKALIEELLPHTNLSAKDKREYRERAEAMECESLMAGARARVEHERAIAACGSTSPLIGGSDPGECDVPREVGSRHARPEKLTEGAAWLQDWRLP